MCSLSPAPFSFWKLLCLSGQLCMASGPWLTARHLTPLGLLPLPTQASPLPYPAMAQALGWFCLPLKPSAAGFEMLGNPSSQGRVPSSAPLHPSICPNLPQCSGQTSSSLFQPTLLLSLKWSPNKEVPCLKWEPWGLLWYLQAGPGSQSRDQPRANGPQHNSSSPPRNSFLPTK